MKNATAHSVRVGLLFCAAALVAFGVGCGSDANGGNTGTGSQAQLGASYCEAATVIQTACLECHGTMPKYGAPMSLVTYADLMAPAKTDPSKRVIDLVSVRIHDPVKPMPQPPFTITPQALATLDSFIQGGAPVPADPTCGAAAANGGGGVSGSLPAAGTGAIDTGSGAGTGATAGAGGPTAGSGGEVAGTTGGTAGTGATADWPADCEEHYQFRAHGGSDMSTPYTVAGGQESHPQFYFAPPWGSDQVQAVAFKPIIDNSAVIHHWILYGNGTGGGAGDAFLNGWAPGNDGGDPLPPDVGMYMPSGSTQLRLDVHYNNTGSAMTQMDNSGVEVCITRHFRTNTATIIGLAASASSAAHQMVTNTKDCRAQVTGGPAHLLSVSPHMHKLGVHSQLKLTPVGGTPMMLNDAPFDFQDQKIYPLNDVLVNNGDVLTTSCTYNNTTDKAVNFGQSTTDEMCFNFTLYYPKGALSCPLF